MAYCFHPSLTGAAGEGDYVTACLRVGEEASPGVHELATLLERIASAIRPLGLIADQMSQSRLSNFTRECRALASPIPKRGAEAVNGHAFNLKALQRGIQRHM